MEWSEVVGALSAAGPIGIWLVAGIGVFRFLLTRNDGLARENITELRKQLREWKLRALRAELVVRAYQATGQKIPRRELAREIELHGELGDLGLFGVLIDEREQPKDEEEE